MQGRVAGWGAVAILLLLYSMAYLDRQIITLMVDPLRRELGATDFQISLLTGFAFVGAYCLFGFPAGWAADRFPRRRAIFGGIVTWSLGAAGGGLAGNYGQLVGCRAIVGAGEAFLQPAAYSILSDLFPRDRVASAVTTFSTGAIIGGALSYALGGQIIALAGSFEGWGIPLVGKVSAWQWALIISGVPGIFMAWLVFLIREPHRECGQALRATEGGSSKLSRYLWSNKLHYLTHFAGFGLFGLMVTALTAWEPTFLMRKFGWSVQRTGFTLGLLTLIFSVGGLLVAGRVVDGLYRKGRHDAHLRFYAGATMIGGLCGLGVALAPDIYIVLLCLALVKSVAPFVPIAAAALQLTAPNQFRGRISALFLLTYNIISWGLGPVIVAAISDFLSGGGGLGMGLAVTFAICTPLALILFLLGLGPMRDAVARQDGSAP